MGIFTTIRQWIVAAGVFIFVALMGYLKYLSSKVSRQKAEIEILKDNAEEQKEITKGAIKKAKFDTKQKIKAKKANDETRVDTADKKRGKVDEKDTDGEFTSVTA